MSFEVDFEPIGLRGQGDPGETILAVAQRAGVVLTAVCGGAGRCGRCLIRVMSGKTSEPDGEEEAQFDGDLLREGWRLACRTQIAGDVRVHVPPESLATAQRTQTEGQSPAVELNPAVHAYDVELEPPTLTDPRSDATRLRDRLGLPDLTFSVHVLRRMSVDLRAHQFHSTVYVKEKSVIGVRPAHALPLGLAVDIGTTKLAAYLTDLANGATLAAMGAMNPQIAFGEDLMARIRHATDHREGAEQLRNAIVEAINGLARDLCAQAGRKVDDIADAVLVGNTAMHHLFLGLPVGQLGQAPYVPAETAALDLPCNSLGLELAPGAYVHLLPNIAAFVGADHVAMLLATGFSERECAVLGIDIGTNTEISLLANGRHFSCSAASGPAFEGAHIRCGMRAAPGAIEEVLIRDNQVLIRTVANSPPVGLCGSGILDLVAQMRHAGILTPRGAFNVSSGHPRLRSGKHGIEFVVAESSQNCGTDITFSHADVSQIQLAKGAIRTGINILLQHAGVTEIDIDEVVIAGAFGTYLNVQSAIDIGMLPRVERRRCRQVGNAAGAGARMALHSMAQRDRAVRLARQVEYIELSAEKGFSSAFVKSLVLE